MKKRYLIMMTALLVLAVAVPLSAKPVTLKFAVAEPANGFNNVHIYAPWIEMVNRDAQGVLKIELYPGGILGRDLKTQLKVVMDGVADMAFVVNAYSPGRFPDDEVVGIPMIARSNLEAGVALQRLYDRGLLRGYDDIVVIGHTSSASYTLHSRRPVKTPDDMKGKKFKATGKLQYELVEAVGAAPVGMSITKVAESLSRGVIDGLTGEPNSMNLFKVFDVVKYHCNVSFGFSNQMIAMNKKKYGTLSPKAKAVLDKYRGEPFARFYGERMTGNNIEILKKYQADPKSVWYTPTAEEMKQWRSLMDPVVEAWKKRHPNGEKLYNAYLEEVLKIRNEK